MSRAALFSINDGDGLSTQLHLLAELWQGLTQERYFPVEYRELRLPDRMDAKNLSKLSDRDIVLENIAEDGLLSPGRARVLCLDITKWLDRVEREDFRAVLSRLRLERWEQVTVFRIPAVDELTLRRVSEAIGWFFNVDVVHTPPYSAGDYYAYLLRRMKEKELEPDARASELIREAVEGRALRDGCWWGFHSIDIFLENTVFNVLINRYGASVP